MSKITLKKHSLFLLIALILLTISKTQAQEIPCIVYDDMTLNERIALGVSEQEFLAFKNSKKASPNQILTNIVIPDNYPITQKKFRIRFWALKVETDTLKNDTLSAFGLNYDNARRQVEMINNFYKDHSICFVLAGIGDFKTDSLHNRSLGNFETIRQLAIQKNAYDPNAINVYIQRQMGAKGSTAYGNNLIFMRENVLYRNSISNVLAHELGHVFGLYHTHGDFNQPTTTSTCYGPNFLTDCEHVTRDPNDPDYNALTNGDKVHDTAADPGLFPSATGQFGHCYNQDANCNYIGNQSDCQGTPYMIDNSVLRNIMSYGNMDCLTEFTPGQRTRMHYLIENGDYSNPNNLLDFANVRAAMVTPDLSSYDLMVRNSPEDFGNEPDTISVNFWQSPDIWVRPYNDNSPYHDNPIYGIGNNYVKVRVVNRGCAASDGTGKLKLYWTKAGTNLPMQVWDGSFNSPWSAPLGGLIGEVNLPVLESYEEHIFTFPWPVPNPADYSTIDEPWHFCLLAKIETSTDVSTLPQDNGVYYHFLNSNNIALHNVNVMNNTSGRSGIIHVGNFEEAPANIKLKLSRDKFYAADTNIFEEAEVKFTFDNKLWTVWQNSGFTGSNFEFFGEKTIIVREDTEIILDNFPGNDLGLLNVKVNFLTDAYTSNKQFGFNVEHWNGATNTLMGGELFLMDKNERDLFFADAAIANTTLSALPIHEPAVYNWYDANGTLLHTGQNYTVTNTNGTYLLEVVADYDGYKDTKEVTVTTNNTQLLYNIYPNPATSNVTVQYNQLNCNSAYLMLVNVNTNASANYILNLNSAGITINTTACTPGLYRVVLVCDNNVTESHNLLIQ